MADYDDKDSKILIQASQMYKQSICDEVEQPVEVSSIKRCDDSDDSNDKIFLKASQAYKDECGKLEVRRDDENSVLFLDVCDDRGDGSYENVDVAVTMPRDGGVEDDSLVEQRFACPVTEDEILKKIDGAIPCSTKKTTLWSVKVWNSWHESRLKSVETTAPPLLDNITNVELNYWLS